MESIEWESYDNITECSHCHEIKPCILIEDSFLSEVYSEGKYPEEYFCKECFSRRKKDI